MAATNTLANLLRQGTIDDHDELLKAANASLKASKSDLEAQHVKVVALLKLDRYEEALQALEAGGDKLKATAQLEYAYALYKTEKPEEAASAAQKAQDRGSRHVEAQARYRSEDFKRAAELYASLASSNGETSNEDVDLRINASAVDAQLQWANLGHLAKSRKPGRQDLEAFETAYNTACGSIARGELAQAEILLKRSKDLCNAVEDLSEDEKRAEIMPIALQQVYVLAKLGKSTEAQDVLTTINHTELADHTSKLIARINSLAITGSDNPFIVQRHLQNSTQIPESERPFGYQTTALKKSEHGAALASQKYTGAISGSRTAIKKQSGPTLDTKTNSLSVLNAAAHARNQSGKEALKAILPEQQKRPEDVGLVLTIVQLHVLAGNKDSPTALLEQFLRRLSQSTAQDVRYAPGLVGTLVSLYSSRGQTGHIRRELADAAKHWQSKTASSPGTLTPGVTNLLKAAGGALLTTASEDDTKQAHSIFTALHAEDPSDAYTAAGLIASSPSTQSPDLEILTPVSTLIKSIDPLKLEEAGVARPTAAPAQAKGTKRPAPAAKEKKAKKPKPSKLPKEYDENKKPDPERWLPLRDRSGYRPKGKKGKGKANMLAQGAVDETSRPSTPGVEQKAAGGGGGGGKQGQNKKKKGKGGKW